MTDADGTAAPKPGEAINGLTGLFARQYSFSDWRVLSLRNDEVTAHTVDLGELTCTCEDQQMNQQGQGVCDHLAVTLLEARKHRAVEEFMLTEISQASDELATAAEHAVDAASAVEDALVDVRDTEAGQAAEASAAEPDAGPVEAVEQFFDRTGIDTSGLDIYEDDQYGSVQVETDGLSDADYDTFINTCQSTDAINWDADNSRNFIKPDDVDEVTG